ncbi:MAG TPA: secondary thiamine-phosphate synthase enzyme YjbQ [bacterium]|nr:secondary thiamine-phosphate synthase enzyme YjbQ [bacterium]
METFSVSSKSRNELIDITSDVTGAVQQSGISDGACVVFTPHTTAAVTINENADPSVKSDITMKLSDVIDQDSRFRHMEGNSDSHIKSSLVGCSEHILVEDGRLVLGTWQGIMFCEFDGPRSRRVHVKVIGQ